MSKYLNKALIVLLALGITSSVHAYIYEFTNHTDQEIAISMRYLGINEPLNILFIEPNEMLQFSPGEGGIHWSKIGFLPEAFFYLVAPTPQQKANIAKAPWKEFTITWIPSSSYENALALAENIGGVTERAGKTAVRAGAAYFTGGTSAAAEAAFSQATKPTQAATVEQPVAGTSYGLAGLLKTLGQVAAVSMMRNRHIDIVKDETGKISFISLL